MLSATVYFLRMVEEVELAFGHPVDDLLVRDAWDDEIDLNATFSRTLQCSDKRICANEVWSGYINPLCGDAKHVDVILLTDLLIIVIWPRGVAKEERSAFILEVRIIITFGEDRIIRDLMGA